MDPADLDNSAAKLLSTFHDVTIHVIMDTCPLCLLEGIIEVAWIKITRGSLFQILCSNPLPNLSVFCLDIDGEWQMPPKSAREELYHNLNWETDPENETDWISTTVKLARGCYVEINTNYASLTY